MEYEDIIRALKDGNVPPEGTFEVCVGRESEINEFERLLKKIGEGKSITKFIEGSYGSGKSFLLKLIEEKSLEKNYVVSKIVITRDVQFNKFEEIYKRIIGNLKCKTGFSLQHTIEKWITELKIAAMEETTDSNEQNQIVIDNIYNDLLPVRKYSNSFVTAIESFYEASINGNHDLANYAQAWLRCEQNIPFTVKKQFGVKGDVTKENAFDFLKALSAFISSIGYKGLVILIDEVEFTMQLPMTKLRTTALDYMRYIYDECNANQFENTLFVLAGTNDFFEDTEKGIPSYKALDQRIRNDFEYDGYKDIRSSIIKLDGFGRDEMLELTQNIFKVYSNVYGKEVINKFNGVIEDIIQFYKEKSMLTGTVQPRDYVKGLVTALDIVQQNPDKFASKNEVLDLFDNLEWVKFEDDLEGIID